MIEYYSTDEVCELLDCTRDQVQSLTTMKLLKKKRISGTAFYLKSGVLRVRDYFNERKISVESLIEARPATPKEQQAIKKLRSFGVEFRGFTQDLRYLICVCKNGHVLKRFADSIIESKSACPRCARDEYEKACAEAQVRTEKALERLELDRIDQLLSITSPRMVATETVEPQKYKGWDPDKLCDLNNRRTQEWLNRLNDPEELIKWAKERGFGRAKVFGIISKNPITVQGLADRGFDLDAVKKALEMIPKRRNSKE